MGRCLKICQMSADAFDFKQKIYCSFLQMEGVAQDMGGHKIGHFLWPSWMYDP